MGQTGIFDVFQAAAGATGTVLDEFDKQNRLKAEMEVQDAALKDKEAFHQFMLDLENSSDWQNYEARWDEFKVRAHNDTAKGLSSPFARRVYDSHYKNAEMEQRLMIKSVAQQKMRAQDFSKGFDYIGNVIASRSFADMETVGEDGKAYTKTATQQKKELIDQKLYMMHEAGLLSYEQFNQSMRDSYASLMKHEMITAGKKSVDEGKSIEEVSSAIQEYKNEFVTVAGGRVSEESVKGPAREEIEAYFYKQQSIRYKNGEQEASRIYRKMSKALANGNWDQAYKAADEGREFLKTWDEKYGGNGFDANVRDEYSDKFLLRDDTRVAGRFGGLAKMSAEEAKDFWLYVMKYGFTDENGNTERFTMANVINAITGDCLDAQTKIIGKEKAMALAYDTLAKLNEAISKPPYCSPGVSASVKHIEHTVKTVMEKDSDFNTLEGMANLNRVFGETMGQVHNYLGSTPFDQQTPEGVEKIVVANLLRAKAGTETKEYLWDNEGKQAIDAAKRARMIARETSRGPNGEDLSSPEVRAYREQNRNYVVQSIKQIEDLTSNDAVLEKYQVDILDDGRAVARDRKTKEPVHVFGYIENKKGEEEYRRFSVRKNADGTYAYTPDAERPSKMRKRKQAEDNKNRAFNRNMDTIGVREHKGTYTQERASESFRTYVAEISPQDQALFTQIRDDYGSRADFKTGAVSNNAQEKRIIDAFKKGKAVLENFEKNEKALIPYSIREDFLSFYNSLTTEYQKSTFIDAYKYARKHPKRSGISLATVLEQYSVLKKERQLKGGNPLNSALYRSVKTKEGK